MNPSPQTKIHEEASNRIAPDGLLMLAWKGTSTYCLYQTRTSVCKEATNSRGRLFNKSMVEYHGNIDKLE